MLCVQEASCLRRNDVPEVTIDDFFVSGQFSWEMTTASQD